MPWTADGSVFGAVSMLFSVCVKISREPLNGFAPSSQERRVWSHRSEEFEGQGQTSKVKVTRDKKRHFPAISAAACGLRLVKHLLPLVIIFLNKGQHGLFLPVHSLLASLVHASCPTSLQTWPLQPHRKQTNVTFSLTRMLVISVSIRRWSDVTVICKHNTISMLWGNTAYILSEVKWMKISRVIRIKLHHSLCKKISVLLWVAIPTLSQRAPSAFHF